MAIGGFGYLFRYLICSYELCAGLMDKNGRNKEQAIVDEIREELGYEVSIDDLQFVSKSIEANHSKWLFMDSCWKCGFNRS